MKGAQRSIICDLQRNSFIYIPNELYEIICKDPLKEESYEKNTDILSCINFLIEQEYGFLTSEPKCFPKITFAKEDFVDFIQNIIIDFDKNSNHDMIDLMRQVNKTACSALELRFYDAIGFDQFSSVLDSIENSTIRSLHIVIKKTKWLSIKTLSKILIKNKRISQIIVHSANTNKSIPIDMKTVVLFTKDTITSETHCGFISPKYFRVNIDLFKESLFKNNCLYRKLCIDKNGDIRNCPAMEKSFGNIKSVRIEDIIQLSDFKKYWYIKKDLIKVYKDCEFRYICHDCRAF